MKRRRFAATLLAFMLIFSSAVIPIHTVSALGDSSGVARVSGRLDHSIAANTIVPIDSEFVAAKGDRVSFDCTYTPKYSSMDFGYLDSDYAFHYLNCVNGKIYAAISFPKSGRYTLAIRNNEDYAVTVTGTVRY